MPRVRKDIFGGTQPGANISPMIDLVFLLLIFFMVASTIMDYQKDENVTIPIAFDAQVPEVAEGRVIINVYEDGTIRDMTGQTELIPVEIERLMARAKAQNPKTRLHIRADRNATHKSVREVIEASSRGGVNSVIFSTYVTER